MASSTADAFDLVCRLDRTDTLVDVPQNNKQEAAAGLLLDELHERDFAGPLACRASKVLGPISRHRVADILPHMQIVSRASRPGLLVGFLRILCNGLCTARRFHTAEHDHTCRVGCPDEPDSLTHYNECPRLHNIFLSFWRHDTILPQRNHFLHDLITRVFLRSLQCGIVVLGFLDAFVYAHHKHRLDSENAGNFGHYMKGRMRFMTAITPAYAHAFQTTCLTAHMPAVPHQNFRLPKLEARYPYLPNDRSITSERGNDYHGWAIIQMVVLALLMGCNFPIPSWANWCHVWSHRHHRGSSCFLWCQSRPLSTLPQTRFSMSRRLGSSLHTIDPLRLFFLFPGALKCWCGTIATVFSQDPRRDSQDLSCFSLVVVPSRWWRQLHVVRAI